MSKATFQPSKFANWTSDIFSGAAVFLVALPLCLGIALASNAPLVSGILAGIVGGILVGAISGSHTSVSGPAAGLTAIIAAQIVALGSFETFLAALVVAGVIQILLGVLRMGFIATFFPSSVIKGLLAAIGIILVLKQLPHLVGWDVDAPGEMSFWQQDNQNTISKLGQMFLHLQEGAMLIGLMSLLILLMWDRIDVLKKSGVPAPLFIVGLGIALSYVVPFLGVDWLVEGSHRVQVPTIDDLGDLSTVLKFPAFSAFLSPAVYLAGVNIALVASLETLLNLEAVDKIDPRQRVSPPNRELIAQGIGNAFLGFVGGIPVTSVIIRSSININAGAKSRISAITHGFLLVFCVVLIPQWLNLIPLSCLAAILIVTGLKLASPKVLKQMWREGINQFLPFAITVTAIIFTDLLIGVVIGLLTSAIFILHSNLRRPLQVVEENHLTGTVQRIVLANQVSFLNRAALSSIFEKMSPGSHVLFDATHTDYIDAEILDLLQDYREKTAPARNVKVSVIGFKERFAFKNELQFVEHSTPELRESLTPAHVLKILKEGNERVRAGKRLQRDLGRQIIATSNGQFPLGVVFSCMDSRAPVELVFDLGIGDIFSVRTAGNVVSEKVLGSLEFASAIAGAKLIVVMGHTRCGAISAAVNFCINGDAVNEVTGCQHLESVVSDIQKIVYQSPIDTIPEKSTSEREFFEDKIARKNVIQSIDKIVQESSMIHRLISHGRIAIIGCVYDVRTGSVDFIYEINCSTLHERTKKKPHLEAA